MTAEAMAELAEAYNRPSVGTVQRVGWLVSLGRQMGDPRLDGDLRDVLAAAFRAVLEAHGCEGNDLTDSTPIDVMSLAHTLSITAPPSPLHIGGS
jgi:hypothetical protein